MRFKKVHISNGSFSISLYDGVIYTFGELPPYNMVKIIGHEKEKDSSKTTDEESKASMTIVCAADNFIAIS